MSALNRGSSLETGRASTFRINNPSKKNGLGKATSGRLCQIKEAKMRKLCFTDNSKEHPFLVSLFIQLQIQLQFTQPSRTQREPSRDFAFKLEDLILSPWLQETHLGGEALVKSLLSYPQQVRQSLCAVHCGENTVTKHRPHRGT